MTSVVLTKGIAGLISINYGVTILFIASRFLSVNYVFIVRNNNVIWYMLSTMYCT